MYFWLSWPSIDAEAPVVEAVTGFEAQVDYELQVQKNLLLAKYELIMNKNKLEAELKSIEQNTDINDSAIRTAQSRLNDTFKKAIYTGSDF